MKRLLGFVGMMGMYFFVAAVFFGCGGWLVHWLGIDWLIEIGLVESDKAYWESLLLMAVFLSVPPFFIFAFHALPDENQEGVKILGLALLDVLSIIGSGILFAAGMSFYFYL